jgi:hypothetical protein
MKFNRPWALAGWARCIALGTRALIGPSRLRSSRQIFAKIRSSNSASSVKHAPFPLEPSSHLSSLSHRLAGRYRFSGLITPDSHEFPAPDPRALFRDTSQTPGGLKRHGSGNRRGKRWQGRNCRLYRPEHKRGKAGVCPEFCSRGQYVRVRTSAVEFALHAVPTGISQLFRSGRGLRPRQLEYTINVGLEAKK